MVRKKGWLRILEATIAVIMILGVMLFLSSQSIKPSEDGMAEKLPPLLAEMAKNESFRELALSQPSSAESEAVAFLASKISDSSLKFAVRVCEIGSNCAPWSLPVSASDQIYASEYIISSTMSEYKPTKVEVRMWREIR